MAIVQISRIQVRRGLQADLPQLAAGEMGWSTDDQRLYIGNGVTGSPDYAPQEGLTEIVTAPNLTEIGTNLLKYTFRGTESGYTSSTTDDPLNPIERSLQQVLDEWVSVKDFGAKGNGITDDTLAINRAIQEIYKTPYNSTTTPVRRTIKFPAGTYLVTDTIRIPPNCTLIGDGKNNTIISGNSDFIVMQSCDSNFNVSGEGLFSIDADLPSYITIKNLGVLSTSTTYSAVVLEAATSVEFNSVKFDGGLYGLSVDATHDGPADNIFVTDCTFTNNDLGAILQGGLMQGVVTRSSYFDTVRVPLYNGSNLITTLSDGAGKIDYEINKGSDYRIGTIKYNKSGGAVAFDDDYSEPSATFNANLFIADSGAITCALATTTATTLKYNITQFI